MSKKYTSADEAMVDHHINIRHRRLTPWRMMHHLGNSEDVRKAWDNLIVDYDYFDSNIKTREPLHDQYTLRFHVPNDTLYYYTLEYTYTKIAYWQWVRVEGSLDYPIINYYRSIDRRKGKREARKKL